MSTSVRPLPRAALGAVMFCLVLTGLCWLLVFRQVDDTKKQILLVGDSFTGNYRFDPGQRLEDLVEASTSKRWQVHNLARPGARTLDMRLQVDQARTLLTAPSKVVLPIFVGKLLVSENYIRLDKRGDNLKWLELNAQSRPVFDTLDAELRKKLAIHKLGLTVGFYDLFEHVYTQRVQWPGERRQMRADSPGRRRKINKKSGARALLWDGLDPTRLDFESSVAAKDLSLLVSDLRAKKTPLLIILLPVGNMDTVRERFSARAQGNLELARARTQEWCSDRSVATVDLVDKLPGQYYDDFTHLKDVEGNRIVAGAIARWAERSE